MNCPRLAVTAVQAKYKPNEIKYVCSRCASLLLPSGRWTEMPNVKFNTGITFCQNIRPR